ncbi:unknown [Prevotella sp. CAG:1185]|nr:unknown [Prevotella sp. CAG:1185]
MYYIHCCPKKIPQHNLLRTISYEYVLIKKFF